MNRQHIWKELSLLLLMSLITATFTTTSQADDPFAPPNTVLIQTTVPSREIHSQLMRMGLQPEEADRHHVHYRVTPQQLEKIRSLGISFRLVEAIPETSKLAFISYQEMVEELKLLAALYPDITQLISCGHSVQDREILAMKITDNPHMEEAEPEVRSIGAHHGNEQMSTEINLNLIHHLVENYGIDSTVTELVDELEIWVVPMMNPDGYEVSSRYNAHGVDLNRNYGYMWTWGTTNPFSEPETMAIRDLSTDNWFVLSLSFHCSGDVVNSVWNYTPIYPQDDDVIVTLSDNYAAHNGYWSVHGWYWYETQGDCNDWSYGARADMDWTIETDNFNEAAVWNENRDAILEFFQSALWGLHGVVTDATTGETLRARVWVEGNGWPALTDPLVGDYHKPLLAGTYTVRFTANGYHDVIIPGVVVPPWDGVTVNAQMTPGGGHYADRVELARVEDPNNSYSNLTLTMSTLGPPEGLGCSLGKGGYIVLDLGPGSQAADTRGDDLIVHESFEDAPGEGFDMYVGSDFMGPWTYVGPGGGTTAFDLAGTGLSSARYINIRDDNDGDPDHPNAGFDLDAVEVLRDPEAIADLRATLASAVFRLSWSPVTTDVDGKSIAVDHYVIYRSTDPAFTPGPTDSIGSTLGISFDDSAAGLQDPGTNHYYTVKAVDHHGKRSADSNTIGEFDLQLGNEKKVHESIFM